LGSSNGGLELLILLAKRIKRGLESIGGSPPREIEEFVAIIFAILLRQHGCILKLLWKTYSHRMRIRTMGDELGRKVLVLPGNPEGLFGPHRRNAIETMASFLSAAIADSLDRIPMFDRDGQPVLVQVVNNRMLAWVLDGYFCTMHVVERAGRLEVEYRGAAVNEMVLGHMLREEETKRGGLLGRLPRLVIERPQVMAVEEKPQVATSNLPEVQRELAAGAAQVARHADADKKRELEMARGAERVAYFEGRRAPIAPPAVEESIPVFIEGQQPPVQEG
jgi:hypothetical protein